MKEMILTSLKMLAALLVAAILLWCTGCSTLQSSMVQHQVVIIPPPGNTDGTTPANVGNYIVQAAVGVAGPWRLAASLPPQPLTQTIYLLPTELCVRGAAVSPQGSPSAYTEPSCLPEVGSGQALALEIWFTDLWPLVRCEQRIRWEDGEITEVRC
jgi:hypothetical protein